MREPAPDYSSHHYQRPNQVWVCGLACDGQACPAGPTARGHCPALAECAPVRNGDRWECNRSALRGGPCITCPTPDGKCCLVNKCRPVRSLRAIRARFVTACTLIAAGALTILLSADWRDRAIAPGPLAGQHAQLLERDGSQPNCAACHAAADRSVGGWAVSLVTGQEERTSQSNLCMECHDKTIPATHALAAHNLPPETLQQITQVRGSNEPTLLARAVRATLSPGEELACATCHREHHGAQADLTAIDDAACQTCHRQKFESFATDHPDFGNWPYERRTRIVFNHATHRAKHFAEQKKTFDCRQCHLDDTTGNVQLLANYETACASCHDEKIATSVARGVPMLALPTLDVDALRTAGHDIGHWPMEATGDFDGRLPPMMTLLLAADADAPDAITAFGADFDFLDVDSDDPEQLAAAALLAAAMKTMLADVSQRGPVAVRERLSAALGRDVSDAQLNAFLAGMSADTVRGAVGAWLPDVDTGNIEWINSMVGRALRDPPTSDSVGRAKLDPPYAPAGAWTRDDATLSIRYRPAAHADPVLTAWLDLLANTPDLSQRPLAAAMFNELTKATAPGLCASCHSVDQSEQGKLAINWRAYDRATEQRGFTKFSHGPHLVLPQLVDCTSCHSIDDAANTASSYADWNPHRFASEFQPISKRACASCHTSTAAGDRCQSCHNYHVDQGSGLGAQGSVSKSQFLNPEP